MGTLFGNAYPHNVLSIMMKIVRDISFVTTLVELYDWNIEIYSVSKGKPLSQAITIYATNERYHWISSWNF